KAFVISGCYGMGDPLAPTLRRNGGEQRRGEASPAHNCLKLPPRSGIFDTPRSSELKKRPLQPSHMTNSYLNSFAVLIIRMIPFLEIQEKVFMRVVFTGGNT
ncbi:MAG: hypothetical protein K8R45_14335, partial [Desulfobacterales bacterium]|nr:hypothetical protein [Desulfobacterales bacterium]